MAQPKLTNWFVKGEAPWEPGVYNVSCRKTKQSGDWWARWDGRRWFCASRYKEGAARTTLPASAPNFWHHDGSWRGLAEKPKEATQ